MTAVTADCNCYSLYLSLLLAFENVHSKKKILNKPTNQWTSLVKCFGLKCKIRIMRVWESGKLHALKARLHRISTIHEKDQNVRNKHKMHLIYKNYYHFLYIYSTALMSGLQPRGSWLILTQNSSMCG